MSCVSVKRVFVGSSANFKKPRTSKPQQHVPRVAKLLALAIVFDQLIRDGVVADQAELAKLGRVTRARVTQIMDLLSLAPAIQEQLLDSTSLAVTERRLRPIAAMLDWQEQTRNWNSIADTPRGSPADVCLPSAPFEIAVRFFGRERVRAKESAFRASGRGDLPPKSLSSI